MGIEFLQQNAPEWITPEPQAGLAPDTPLYERGTNTPLPYIQDAGGPRSYLSMTGSASYAPQEGAPQGPIQATTAPTLPPLAPGAGPVIARPSNRVQIPMELRGRTGEIPRGPGLDRPGLDLPASAYPADNQAPRDILAPPAAGRMGEAPVVGIPPANGNVIGVEAGRRGEQLRHMGTRAVVPIPPDAASTVAGAAIRQRQTEDRVAGLAANQRGGSTTPTPQSQGPAGNNRMQPADMRIQDLFTRPGATLRDMIHATGGRFDWAGARQEQPWTPEPEDTTVSRPANTRNVRRTSATRGEFIRPENAGQWEGRAPEIETWIRAANIRLTEGAAYRTGNARSRGHPAGNSIDVPPDQLEAFVARLNQHPEFRNIPRQQIFVEAGTDFGNGVVASADHYHFDFGSVAER